MRTLLSFAVLNNPRFFERPVQTELVHGFDAASGNGNSHIFFKFGDVNAPLLEIRVATVFTGRVKLRGASSVAVTAADHRTLFCNWTSSCHKFNYLKNLKNQFQHAIIDAKGRQSLNNRA